MWFVQQGAGLTCAYGGEEEQPEEAEDGRRHHLGDGSRVDLLVQFGGQVGVVHVVPVHQVFQQHVHETCRGTGEAGRHTGGSCWFCTRMIHFLFF